jgi:hypothetical protein
MPGILFLFFKKPEQTIDKSPLSVSMSVLSQDGSQDSFSVWWL